MYDLVVIGAGWAGFNAALKAKKSGLKVCLVERGEIGGTCLNRGCIPTKSLIASAKIYSLIKKSAVFGIDAGSPSVDFNRLKERKEGLVRILAEGMRSRLSGVDFVRAEASIISEGRLEVGGSKVDTKFTLIATGSVPVGLEGLKFDGERVISSNEALDLAFLPRSLLIIGGGVIGCEFAGLFSALGSDVTIAEKLPSLLPGEDRDISRKMETFFKKKGVKVITGTDPLSSDLGVYEKIVVCVGRRPDTAGLGLDKLGIKSSRGIEVDDFLMTGLNNVYAAGDCTAKRMLAHYAAYQGEAAVENMLSGNRRRAAAQAVPSCVFTDPEIASVGLSEEAASASGIQVRVHKFDFRASAMARVSEEAEGFIKIVSRNDSGEILGGCIIGPRATEMIAVLTVAICAGMDVERMRQVIFAHPTISESLHEALS
ncbi:MAG: dihydrolipoyl dehydrogenase [Candidatus Omnitrophica bacterium]|nr:dihydrolipoyl dehydrogenase [Candidatus Omnitrophota bacterium]